jgi:hypothetical protein
MTGFDVPSETSAQSPVDVIVGWYDRDPPQGVALHLAWLEDSTAVRSTLLLLGASTSPSSGMGHSHHTITAPSELGSGRLYAAVAIDTDLLPARCSWLARPADYCPLDKVHIQPASAGLANYANRITLLQATADTDTGASGDPVRSAPTVTLRWRAQRTMDEDYTLFIHLVGPDGRVHGQIDTWLLQGSFPTNLWQPGQEIIESYTIPIAGDAPAGKYQIHVGWYLLATMQRLQLLDSSGAPTGDSFVVDTLELVP